MRGAVTLTTDVLVIGAGGAGMYGAVSAARHGAKVLLIDKNVVGRGGATIMAQMTCASALGEAEEDSPDLHLQDTLEAGRGLCNESLAALLCEESPQRIRELGSWGVNWARSDGGGFSQVKAPGHNRKRCVYVDYLATGTAICATLRNKVSRDDAIRRLSNATITDIVVHNGAAVGAVGYDIPSGAPLVIKAGATLIASGGMTKMFQRTTASNNLCGEGIGLALRAGTRLTDIEFLQFYPNGHLAPRMVGLDPTTWEPTRVKLGGRLLNGYGEEFLQNYTDTQGGGAYDTARDVLTYAIYKEVEEGRGSPAASISRSSTCRPTRSSARSGRCWKSSRATTSISPRRRSRYSRSPITRWGALRWIPRWRPGCPASMRRARWLAAPTGRIVCLATRSPRRWCSASGPARARRVMPSARRRATGIRPSPRPTSIRSEASSAGTMAAALRRGICFKN
jgi:hypothetical protein